MSDANQIPGESAGSPDNVANATNHLIHAEVLYAKAEAELNALLVITNTTSPIEILDAERIHAERLAAYATIILRRARGWFMNAIEQLPSGSPSPLSRLSADDWLHENRFPAIDSGIEAAMQVEILRQRASRASLLAASEPLPRRRS